MIVKACFGNKKLHCRIIECDDIHIEDIKDEKGDFTELIAHRRPEDMPVGTIHLGKHTNDTLFLMDKGKTVDTLRFYKDTQHPYRETKRDCSCKHASSEVLLVELLSRLQEHKVEFTDKDKKMIRYTISISSDDTATIEISGKSLDVLDKRTK